MDQVFLHRPISDWIAAGCAFLFAVFVFPMFRAVLKRRFKETDGGGKSWRALIARLNNRWLRLTTITLAIAVGALFLNPDQRLAHVIKYAAIVMLAIQFMRLIPGVVDWAFERLTPADSPETERAAFRTTLAGLRWVVLLLLFSTIVLIALQNMGVDVTAMVAGLGIGGIAIALAVQNTLGDLFASLTIALDKPFVVGDFIVVGDEAGNVENVGLKTTRVRSLSGEQLVFSNSDLLASRIRNFKRMYERRVVLPIGVPYSTSPETLEQIPGIVRDAVQHSANTRFDRCLFKAFGESSFDFEAVYFVLSPEFNDYVAAQHIIMVRIVREFNARNIGFAFPTRTLEVAGMNSLLSSLRAQSGPSDAPPSSPTSPAEHRAPSKSGISQHGDTGADA